MPADVEMRKHLTDTEVAALVYAELRDNIAVVDTVRHAHIAACPSCRAKVDGARRLDADAEQWLHALDVPVPTFDMADVKRHARPSRHGNGWTARRLVQYPAIAASIVLCMLGAVAFALPTSPLGHTIRHLVGLERTSSPHVYTNGALLASRAAAASNGIALNPTGPLTIEFRGGTPSSLQVRYCDTTLAALYVVPRNTRDSVASRSRVRFAVAHNRIRIATPDVWDDFVLMLPETAHDVSIIDGDTQQTTTLGTPPSGHVAHGCHAPTMIRLTP